MNTVIYHISNAGTYGECSVLRVMGQLKLPQLVKWRFNPQSPQVAMPPLEIRKSAVVAVAVAHTHRLKRYTARHITKRHLSGLQNLTIAKTAPDRPWSISPPHKYIQFATHHNANRAKAFDT
jgi:hypothetical protein